MRHILTSFSHSQKPWVWTQFDFTPCSMWPKVSFQGVGCTFGWLHGFSSRSSLCLEALIQDFFYKNKKMFRALTFTSEKMCWFVCTIKSQLLTCVYIIEINFFSKVFKQEKIQGRKVCMVLRYCEVASINTCLDCNFTENELCNHWSIS